MIIRSVGGESESRALVRARERQSREQPFQPVALAHPNLKRRVDDQQIGVLGDAAVLRASPLYVARQRLPRDRPAISLSLPSTGAVGLPDI